MPTIYTEFQSSKQYSISYEIFHFDNYALYYDYVGNVLQLLPLRSSCMCVKDSRDSMQIWLQIIQGQFSFFENQCIEVKSSSLGCQPTLNLQACLMQKQNLSGDEAQCFFGKKCIDANEFHLRHLQCKDHFSMYGCVNIHQKQCYWSGTICSQYEGPIPSGNDCSQIFNTAVAPELCSQIQEIPCIRFSKILLGYNNGFEGGYSCENVSDSMLQAITCDTSGLNQVGCTSIKTPGQKCIFQHGICRQFEQKDEISCLQLLNMEACLGISNPAVRCAWKQTGCQDYEVKDDTKCSDVSKINPSVCMAMSELCEYDKEHRTCIPITALDQINCRTKGLSKNACLQIKEDKCIFHDELGCSELTEEQLKMTVCEDNINEISCISITTPFQNCQWNGQKCQRIIINQDLDCPLPLIDGIAYKVNGNVCQSISKNGVGCKYDSTLHLCVRSNGFESCTTPFINLFACVNIQQQISCKWNEQVGQCEDVEVIELSTSCSDLKFSNPKSCSQVTEFKNNKFIGCYYNEETSLCTEVNLVSLIDMECEQMGLNKHGCTMISKLGQRCRWYRNQCTKIKSKESLSLVNCIELQFVNPAICALVTANSEPCKYNSDAFGCVNSVNYSDTGDYCTTPGLNAFACSQITRSKTGCYFDKTNNICVTAPDSKSVQEIDILASKELLTTAGCVASSPTLNICMAIKTLGESCIWNTRSSRCDYNQVQLNEKCLDYNTQEKQKSTPGAEVYVNENVCASIVMNFPNNDPAKGKKVDVLRGYCEYNGKGNCILYQDKPCTDKCCTTVSGINAHVCSRYTDQTVYCYFNEFNKCVQLTNEQTDLTSIQAVKDYYNFMKYKCSSMNSKSCWMIEWSTTQKCYWDGLVCTQINYSDYPTFSSGVFPPTSLSRYGCQGVEAIKSNYAKYFKYLDTNYCAVYLVPPMLTDCETAGVNINYCLGYSANLYCKWNKLTLSCERIEDYLTLLTCDENQNQQACISNPYMPCAFLDGSDKCVYSPQNVKCNDFSLASSPYFAKVNEQACKNITMPGQICKFYEPLNYCVYSNETSTNCDLPGVNSIGCYANTQGNCRWDSTLLECYEESDESALNTLKCNDNINLYLCKNLMNDNCEWSTTDLICSQKDALNKVNVNNLYNAQTCTNLVGGGYYFSNYKCVELLTSNNDCTSKIMNKHACLTMTKNHRCIFDPDQPPELKCQEFKEEQLTCSSDKLISIDVCMNLPATCYFDLDTLTCRAIDITDTTKCSTLISTNQIFNKLACSSVSETLTDASSDDGTRICTSDPVADNAQQCYFESYCAWDTTNYGCKLAKIVNAQYSSNYNGAYCSLAPVTFQCTNIYSKAICLQLADNCYFDITQGGCNDYVTNSYKVQACNQLNGNSCINSKTENAYCKKVALDGYDFTPACSVDSSITDLCEDDVYPSSGCSSITPLKAEDCSFSSEKCYYKNSACVVPSSSDVITCTTPGVSRSLCLTIDYKCDFSSGKCTNLTIPILNADKSNYYYVCNEANYLITQYKEYACGLIQTIPCKYAQNSCQRAFYDDCSNLIGITSNKKACVECKNKNMMYDQELYTCVEKTDLSSSCDSISTQNSCQTHSTDCEWNDVISKCIVNLTRLNQNSCISLSNTILTKWDSTTNTCVKLSLNSAQYAASCLGLGKKSCLTSKSSCWFDSQTQSCIDIDTITLSCSEINDVGGQQQHCLLSFKEACKWVNNLCVSASLETDTCSVMNKFGCLNIKQNISCGWSNYNVACIKYTNNNYFGCKNYIWNNNYSQVNPYFCQLLQGTESCFYDLKTFKCTNVGSTDLYCSKHQGINKLACLTRTLDKCKFDSTINKCVPITETDNNCNNSLNQVSCLTVPGKYCKFYLNECSTLTLATATPYARATPPAGQTYSATACVYYNNAFNDAYFIYDDNKQYCVDADYAKEYPRKFIALCRSTSINERVCLRKTINTCQYVDNQCLDLSADEIKLETSCNSAFNWKACIQINNLCKFYQGRCQLITSTDTCANLVSTAANPLYVGPQVCASFATTLCKYDSEGYDCQAAAATNETCQTPGLSKKACLESTTKSFCYFNAITNKCDFTYDNTLSCQDDQTPKTWYLNIARCYYLRKAGSTCQFLNGECTNFPETKLAECNTDIKTNLITCSKATVGFCYYIPATNYCYKGSAVTVNVQDWNIGQSFNKNTCLGYQHATIKVATMWDDLKGCVEATSNDLKNLLCESPINVYACLSITNPTQFCQYDLVAQKCKSFNYIVPPGQIGTCASLTNVNRFEFCQYTTNDCAYNSATRNCQVLTTADFTIASAADCFNRGFSKSFCSKFPLCKYSDERQLCYGGSIFCKDKSLDTCSSVTIEPCWINNNICTGITYAQLNTVKCSDVINQVGCTSITNPDYKCQFNIQTSICQEITQLNLKCTDYTYVNTYSVCENTVDVPCKYDFVTKSCKQVIKTDVFECDRGLNEQACQIYTRPSLKCLFKNFCFGPTYGVNQCSDSINKEVCLGYNYLCTWDSVNKVCQDFDITGKTCSALETSQKVVSIQVCYNSQADTGACVYNSSTNTCKLIQPISCYELETQEQCTQLLDLPCIWSNNKCSFLQTTSTDTCNQIGNVGSKRACLDIIRQGQMCQYVNKTCQTHIESFNDDNCVDNINKVACVTQQASQCLWSTETKEVFISKTDKINYTSRICTQYTPNSQQDCSTSLSYASCFSVNKPGSFCRWLNGQCVSIPVTIVQQTIYYNTYILVNENSCGLVNVDKVKYSEKSKSCLILDDNEVISCKCGQETKGININACLSIKYQNCKWNSVNKKCVEQNSKCDFN
ncbi:unnamed protein product [Paramecium octaurelia]|uniref:Uncharacterized protein n=1 Tax=Paramecium octaurelia TaxID=43137 RepID=A0A8S1WMS8_PAROT|nr:unnamed protein product [Paramecium octaurelia]